MRRITIEQALKTIEDSGYVYVSGYEHTKSDIIVNCKQHGDFKIEYSNLKQGKGCPDCAVLRTKQKLKIPFEEVKLAFTKRGYTLISTEYHNRKLKLEFMCPTHPERVQKISLESLLTGCGCHVCGRIRSNLAKSGSNNHGWKGGVSSLYEFVRNRLQRSWAVDSRMAQNNTCFVTGVSTRTIEVHHATKTFVDICNEVLADHYPLGTTYSTIPEQELSSLTDAIIELHYSYGHGVCLDKAVHKLFHKLYPVSVNPFADLLEFRELYKQGELYDYAA